MSQEDGTRKEQAEWEGSAQWVRDGFNWEMLCNVPRTLPKDRDVWVFVGKGDIIFYWLSEYIQEETIMIRYSLQILYTRLL